MSGSHGKDAVGILIRHQTEGNFEKRLGGKNGFTPLALVSSADAIDFGGRPRADLLDSRIAGFAEKLGHASLCGNVGIGQR